MIYSRYSLFVIAVFCLFGYITCYNSKKEINQIVLDPIKETPEWYQLLAEEVLLSDGLHAWIPTGKFETSSLIKVPRFIRKYRTEELQANIGLKSFIVHPTQSHLTLDADVVRNERYSGQIALASTKNISTLRINTTPLKSSEGGSIGENDIQIRFVGYVPVERGASEFVWSAKYEEVAGYAGSGLISQEIIADPLYEYTEVAVPAYRAQAIWISIDIPESIPVGTYSSIWTAENEIGESIELIINIKVLEPVLPSPSQYKFFLDFWINPDAIANWHNQPLWSQAHWNLIKIYLKDYADLGGKTITTTIVPEPWQIPWKNGTMRSQTYTGFSSMISWIKRKDNTWQFDYSVFDKYIETAFSCGISDRINAFSMTSFRGRERIQFLDEKTGKIKKLHFDSVNNVIYQEIWKIFLIDFVKHLKRKEWLDITYLCFDEKEDDVMSDIITFINKAAPAFNHRISIAGHPGSTKYASGDLSISYEFFPNQNLASIQTLSIIEERINTGKQTTFYLCGQPAHPNTLCVSPAIEARMIPWLALKYHTDGYLRWAYNSWTKDPFLHPTFNFIQGDEYLIYPGESKPLASIRRELLLDGIEDFELLRIVESNVAEKEKINRTIEIATRNQDGRLKTIRDLINARQLLTKQ